MWTRKELKDKAKGALKVNYWKTILVTLIVLAIAGGVSGYNTFYTTPTNMMSNTASVAAGSHSVLVEDDNAKVSIDGDQIHVSVHDDDSGHSAGAFDDGKVTNVSFSYAPGIALFGLAMLLVGLVVAAINIAFYAFILNPIEVGAQRFFLRNLNQPAEVKEIAYSYDNNYKEIVKTMFLRYLFIFLWSLLLIIPGIVKSYEYRMIPYLLAEDPTMTKERAFQESKRMMTGQKWNTFVLDLSFLGWYILSGLTLGILAIFYVSPYHCLTSAALYEKLRYGTPAPQPQAYDPYGQPPAQPGQPGQPYQPYQSYQPYQNMHQPGQNTYQPTQPMYQPTQPVYQPAPIELPPVASTHENAPIITNTSQPPVPPFAAPGAEPAIEADEPSEPGEPTNTEPSDNNGQAGEGDSTQQ